MLQHDLPSKLTNSLMPNCQNPVNSLLIIINLTWGKAADRIDQRFRLRWIRIVICMWKAWRSEIFQLVIDCKFTWGWVSQYHLQVGESVFAHFNFCKETLISSPFFFIWFFEFINIINIINIRNIKCSLYALFFSLYFLPKILIVRKPLGFFDQRLLRRSTKFSYAHLPYDFYDYDSLLAKFVGLSFHAK